MTMMTDPTTSNSVEATLSTELKKKTTFFVSKKIVNEKTSNQPRQPGKNKKQQSMTYYFC